MSSEPISPDENDSSCSFSWTSYDPALINIYQQQGLRLDTRGKDIQGTAFLRGSSVEHYPNCSISVHLSRPFIFDEQKQGFRWHKTWKLPDIRVVCKVADSVPSNDLTVRITCVCHTESADILEDLGLEGITRQPVVDGECRFSRLRFKSTSSLQRGRQFYLLVSLFQHDSNCMVSVISKGVYVYSRKDADKKRKRLDGIKESVVGPKSADEAPSRYAPFLPELFDKVFIRKSTDHRGHKVTERIENSPQGLLSYFQAPNIRCKCRHPVFLLYRFSNALVLLRDSELFPLETTHLFRAFLSDLGTFSDELLVLESVPLLNSTSGNPRWYISCRQGCKCGTEARRKIFENMDLLKSDRLGFVAESSLVDSHFEPVRDMESLRLEYERLYALNSNRKRSREDAQIYSGENAEHSFGQLDEINCSPFLENSDISSYLPVGYTTSGSIGNVQQDECLASSMEARLFKERFLSNHLAIRRMLSSLTEAAVHAVTDHSSSCIFQLQSSYEKFFNVLSAHANTEDQLIFPILLDRVPGITESYNLDHFMEGKELTAIGDAIMNFDPHYAGDLFIRITGFSANLSQHMDKEERHILPRLLQVLRDDELHQLRKKMVRESSPLEDTCSR